MLTESQAREIARASIRKTVSKDVPLNSTLQDAGVDSPDMLNELVRTLVADTENGVPHFEHYLDPNIILDELRITSTGDELAEKVLKLSAGKLCSNPSTPHPQQCCPYPAKCPQCGYTVL